MTYPDAELPPERPDPAEYMMPGDPVPERFRRPRTEPPAQSDPRGPLSCPICLLPQSVCIHHDVAERRAHLEREWGITR